MKTEELYIRDPYIYADTATEQYCMYGASADCDGITRAGVVVYASRDLKEWSAPQTVLNVPYENIKSVWAPEMHEYNGAFYLFATLNPGETLSENKPVDKPDWPQMTARGTHIFRSDSPMGPFLPLKSGSHTPEGWMSLDGTLYVEDGTPYMVFCHEWVQLIDGTMDAVKLTDDLSDTAGEPEVLFKASAAPGHNTEPYSGLVTDGCFLYKSRKSGKLFMIWSTGIPGSGYCVVLTHSESGKITGPWKEHSILYPDDGGHGMLFSSFEGKLLMSLHQPNSGGKERLHLFKIEDDGKTLSILREMTGNQ